MYAEGKKAKNDKRKDENKNKMMANVQENTLE